jgi:benzil reductase ((S)-benzoin forming)
MATHDTLIWISGATDGIGWGLARTVPYDNARVINLSRRQHPDLETIRFDLSQPETWDAVEESFKKELANFQGKRVIFIHNAFFRASPRFIGEGEPVNYREEIIGNGMAPQVLGDMFLRHVQPHYESGLVLMSSAAARSPFEGHAVYCAAKSGVEMWVRVVRRELKRRGKKTWVVAIRPGFVDTPTTRAEALVPVENYPIAQQMAKQLQSREGVMTPEEAGVGIWAMLPPKEDTSVLMQGEVVTVKQ